MPPEPAARHADQPDFDIIGNQPFNALFERADLLVRQNAIVHDIPR